MHGRRQRSHSFDEDQDGEWWPPPLTEQDVATRQRATRLLQAIRQIPLVYYDIKAWENQHENVFSLFRQGCLDAANSNILEAPLYNNRQIEDAWLFLLEMRRRHKNRGKHVQECARVLGASYNWSIVLQGSKKVLEALNDLPQEVCTEILEGADAHELLRSIYPQRRPRRDDWMNTPSSLPANGWSDSDPSWMGKDTPNGAGTRDAWPDAAWPDAGRTKNPFKAEGVATEWPDPPAQVPQTPGQRDVFPGPTGGSFASAAAIPEKSAFGRPDTNPFRKEASPKSGNPFNAAAIPEKSAFGRPDTNPFRKEVAPKSGNPFHAQRIPAGV